ncbi:hypothetical protein D3C77_363550 [compost metagenome]
MSSLWLAPINEIASSVRSVAAGGSDGSELMASTVLQEASLNLRALEPGIPAVPESPTAIDSAMSPLTTDTVFPTNPFVWACRMPTSSPCIVNGQGLSSRKEAAPSCVCSSVGSDSMRMEVEAGGGSGASRGSWALSWTSACPLALMKGTNGLIRLASFPIGATTAATSWTNAR